MTPATVTQRVNEIEAIAATNKDDATNKANALFVEVLTDIARGTITNPRQCARIALTATALT